MACATPMESFHEALIDHALAPRIPRLLRQKGARFLRSPIHIVVYVPLSIIKQALRAHPPRWSVAPRPSPSWSSRTRSLIVVNVDVRLEKAVLRPPTERPSF